MGVNFHLLPIEIVYHTFSYLSAKDKAICLCVCHKWNNIIKEPQFWLREVARIHLIVIYKDTYQDCTHYYARMREIYKNAFPDLKGKKRLEIPSDLKSKLEQGRFALEPLNSRYKPLKIEDLKSIKKTLIVGLTKYNVQGLYNIVKRALSHETDKVKYAEYMEMVECMLHGGTRSTL